MPSMLEDAAGLTPPFFEERNLVRNGRTNRVDVNVIRYHQGGWATGRITIAQVPNAPLVVFLVAAGVRWLFHPSGAVGTVVDVVDNARQKISDTASKAQDRVARASTDLETTIERSPLVAVLIAMVAGIFVGMVAGMGLLGRGGE